MHSTSPWFICCDKTDFWKMLPGAEWEISLISFWLVNQFPSNLKKKEKYESFSHSWWNYRFERFWEKIQQIFRTIRNIPGICVEDNVKREFLRVKLIVKTKEQEPDFIRALIKMAKVHIFYTGRFSNMTIQATNRHCTKNEVFH